VRNISKRLALACTVLCLSLAPLIGQEQEPKPALAPQYSLGDQTLAINAGLFVPLFFLDTSGPSAHSTNLTIGGLGSLQWMAYLSPQIRLGLEAGGMFTFSPNANLLLVLPITAKISYSFTFYPIEIPIFLGAGISIVKYQDESTIDPILKPGFSVLYIFDSSWSFGVNTVYWWDMMFSKESGQSRIGNFLEFSLTALYHF
jgi:hypothetical protein